MWKYFSSADDQKRLSCACCEVYGMDYDFMVMLDDLRNQAGFPFVITSGYRCPKHNNAVSSTGLDGPHTTGRAVDVSVSGKLAFELVGKAIDYGFTGVGVAQKGPVSGRFIHIDNLPEIAGRPRPWIWTY